MKTSRRFRSLGRGAAILLVLFFLFPLTGAPAQAADAAWTGEYFANQDLSGSPAFTRTDPEINFNWGLGAPDPRLPADHFSIRWTRKVSFTAGHWRFNVNVDDGVRLFVDGQVIIDQWRITAPIDYTSSIWLAEGDHDLRVDYFENTERAQIRLGWEQEAAPPAVTYLPTEHAGAWQGSYFNNRDLSGDPDFQRNDALVYFDWGDKGPGGDLAGQDFSVRWYRKVNLPGGTYRFKVTVDDGVRVWLDWKTIIDEWHQSSGQTYKVERQIDPGDHEIVVEYYQGPGVALIKFGWEDATVDWVGHVFTCMRPSNAWVKLYRLTPDNQWEDLKAEGYGPSAAGGELKLFGVPIDGGYGWDGQPLKIELWDNGSLVRTEGDIFAGQPALRLQPGGLIQTSWPCGAAAP